MISRRNALKALAATVTVPFAGWNTNQLSSMTSSSVVAATTLPALAGNRGYVYLGDSDDSPKLCRITSWSFAVSKENET